MTRSLSIILEGIELRGRCGVTAEERAIGQTLVVDVRLDPQSRGARARATTSTTRSTTAASSTTCAAWSRATSSTCSSGSPR